MKTEELVGGCRRPKNLAEAQFYDACIKKRISVTRRGWPDYACVGEDGRFFVVEVKPKRSARLKKHQMRLLRILSSYGITAYRWSPGSGFESIHVELRDRKQERASQRDRYGLGYSKLLPFQ